ncbi:hypothetical protein [Ammonifex degensii]|nr:hypothetical protein [Ammonifex degensii]
MPLAAGAIFGAVMGATVVNWIPERVLQRLLGVVFLLVAARLIGGR